MEVIIDKTTNTYSIGDKTYKKDKKDIIMPKVVIWK